MLLAEDDTDLRELIAGGFRDLNFEVIEACDGLELLDQAGLSLIADGVDVIISDIRMPGWSGLEVLAGLTGAGVQTPVVLITAFADHETRAAAKRLGAAALLHKPVTFEELSRVVTDAIERSKQQPPGSRL